MTPDTRVVVVGAGLGGFTLAEALRSGGFTGPLCVLGEEAHPPYDRPPLSKQVLTGAQDGPVLLRPAEEVAALGLDLRAGVEVSAVDLERREVLTAAGERLGYDVLVLAPGAVPRRLPGADLSGVHVLRTHDDALALREEVAAAGRLVVVGGGFLGCEAATSARSTGAEVVLVEALPGPLVLVLGPVVADHVREVLERSGVTLRCGVGVSELRATDGRVSGVVLADGSELEAPVVLVGLGVVPATGWLSGSGLELLPDGAVACDDVGRTSSPDVWALGDAASWGQAGGGRRRVEHWTSALEQAASVAAALLDAPAPAHGPAYFWSDLWTPTGGSALQALGAVAPGTEREVHPLGDGLLALHADAADPERLLGVVTVDARRAVGKARRLLRSGASTSEARAALTG